MTQNQFLSPALRSSLSTFLAEAVALADLPPLTKPGDGEFIIEMMEAFIDAFWRAYAGQLGELAQKRLVEAGRDETGEEIWNWLKENADFENNEGARLLAREIVEDFSARLPSVLAEAHADYLEHAKQTP